MGKLFPDTAERRPACRFGAYLEDLELFDAPFFRISPVEAQMLDPQQRLMLETSWRALEDAGLDPERLAGSRTGVYAGISNNEYRSLIMEVSDTTEPAASLYTVTGTSFNTAIGRVAFALGLEGPAMAVDTACSSSLVALHQAVSGLQRGETDLALAGGVHTILSGRLLELRANAGMLSPDGRCKTFDAAANGYVRGEGCGIVVLKRLAEAEADGDRIWAVIRATALNQDGASPGLTVPSGPAQERVIEAALQRAGIAPADVDYVEAHGTGTEVGDPIEANATGAAYGRGRPADRPLLIGSVKTNIGHLESAAGVAGVMKVVLAMQQGVIPPHLHFHEPSPQMDWARLPLRVTAEATEWPLHSGHPPLAGVSGFGWSGTNAHVLLQGYPAAHGAGRVGVERAHWAAGRARPIAVTLPERVAEVPPAAGGLAARASRLLPLSGKSEQALRDLANGYLGWLDEHGAELEEAGAAADVLSDLAWTADTGRSHFAWRAGVVFRDAASLREGLRALVDPAADGTPLAPAKTEPKVAFAFTGQASQWAGMGQALYASEPVVRAVLDRCDALLHAERGASLLDVMFGRPGAAGELDEPAWKQPAIYALECALAALWASLGIRPDVVVGHSLGEIAAAQTAGVFSLEDGLRFAAARGALIGALPEAGAMAVVFAPAERVAAAVAEHNASAAGIGLCVAVDNGSNQVVSGPAADVAALLARFEAEQVRVRLLRNSPAYHSALVEPALDDLEQALERVTFAAPAVPLVSNLSGRLLETVPDAAYWRRHAREKVQFRQAVETLAGLGVEALVEVGPHAVLGPMAVLAWPAAVPSGGPPAVVASLRRPSRDTPPAEVENAFTAAVAGAYEAGLPVRFEALFAGEERRRISLPGYPFQRGRHWIPTARRPRTGSRPPIARASATSRPAARWRSTPRCCRQIRRGWPTTGCSAGCWRRGRCMAPWRRRRRWRRATAQRSSRRCSCTTRCCSRTAESGRTGPRPWRDARCRSCSTRPGDGIGPPACRFSAGARMTGEWTLHAEARLTSEDRRRRRRRPLAGWILDTLKDGMSALDMAAFYRAKAAVGIELGPSFRTLEAVWARPGEAVGEVVLPTTLGWQRAGRASAPARWLLPGDGGGTRPGGGGRPRHLPAVRMGAAVAGRKPAGPPGLPRARRRAGGRRGGGGARRRAAGSPHRRAAHPCPGRRPARGVERLPGQARHPGGAAVRGGGRGGPAVRSGMARPCALPPGMPSADFLTAPSAIADELGAVHRLPGGRRRRRRRTAPRCWQTWSGWRVAMRWSPWTSSAGNARRARPWTPARCASATAGGRGARTAVPPHAGDAGREPACWTSGRKAASSRSVPGAPLPADLPRRPRGVRRRDGRRATCTGRTKSGCFGAVGAPWPTCCAGRPIR